MNRADNLERFPARIRFPIPADKGYHGFGRVHMSMRYATAPELQRILRSRVSELYEAIGLGFLQMSQPVDAAGRALDFIEVQVPSDQAEDLPSEVSMQMGGYEVWVRLRATHPVQQYVPLRASRS